MRVPESIRTVFGRPTGRPYVKTAAEALAESLRNMGTRNCGANRGRTKLLALFGMFARGVFAPVRVAVVEELVGIPATQGIDAAVFRDDLAPFTPGVDLTVTASFVFQFAAGVSGTCIRTDSAKIGTAVSGILATKSTRTAAGMLLHAISTNARGLYAHPVQTVLVLTTVAAFATAPIRPARLTIACGQAGQLWRCVQRCDVHRVLHVCRGVDGIYRWQRNFLGKRGNSVFAWRFVFAVQVRLSRQVRVAVEFCVSARIHA